MFHVYLLSWRERDSESIEAGLHCVHCMYPCWLRGQCAINWKGFTFLHSMSTCRPRNKVLATGMGLHQSVPCYTMLYLLAYEQGACYRCPHECCETEELRDVYGMRAWPFDVSCGMADGMWQVHTEVPVTRLDLST